MHRMLRVGGGLALLLVGAVSIGALALSYQTQQKLKALQSTIARLPTPAATNQPEPETTDVEKRLNRLENNDYGVSYALRDIMKLIDATPSPRAVSILQPFTLKAGQSTILRQDVSFYRGTTSPDYLTYPFRLDAVKVTSDGFYEITVTYDGNTQQITVEGDFAYPRIRNTTSEKYIFSTPERPQAYIFKSSEDKTSDVHGASIYVEIMFIKEDGTVYFHGVPRAG